MPELPEVQTIVNQLEKFLVGRKIENVEILLPKMFVGDRKAIIGRKIEEVSRRAKMIIIGLDNGKYLVVHLKMTGQLIFSELRTMNNELRVNYSNPIPFAGSALPARTTHVIFHLDKGTLFFNDMRRFGWVKVMTKEELAEVDKKHGPEPFDFAHGKPTEFGPEYLLEVCSKWNRPIKLLLLEQSKIAGIGNIYANEALWCAKLNPLKKGKEVAVSEPAKVRILYKCIQEVLEKALKYGGSSAADEAFVNVEGLPGKMQEHFNVYQKSKKPCPRGDGGTIQFVKVGGRGTFFCPVCQQ